MRRVSGTLATVLAGLFVTMLAAACTTTQSPGRQLDDNAIQTQVKAKLTGSHFSNLVNIDVNVTNGVVTLAGEVPNADVRARAVKEASSVDGVVRVVDNLQVESPPRS
jgi:osmotically-inducible protein OsmY